MKDDEMEERREQRSEEIFLLPEDRPSSDGRSCRGSRVMAMRWRCTRKALACL